nr:immunoglobulin light chain junction region [Macaca mulatta]
DYYCQVFDANTRVF